MDDLFEAVETLGDDHVGGWMTADDGARLWVDVHGRGRPVILVHGWGAGSAFWRRQLCLADRFQIVTLDLRGHGRSNAVPRGHTLERLARDLHDVLLGLHLDHATLVGWSMGGSVVLEHLRLFGAARLAAMILVESCPYPFSDAPWNGHRLRDHNLAAMEEDLRRMSEDQNGYGGRFVDGMFLSYQAPAHARQWMVAEHLRADAAALAALYRDYARRDLTPVLPAIPLPCLAMYGLARHVRAGGSAGRFVAGAIPGARLVTLEHSGHLPFYEETDLFNRELAAFLGHLP